MNGFGPLGILTIVVIVLAGSIPYRGLPVLPVGALLVLAWAWRCRVPWRDIGYSVPRAWLLTASGGIVVGAGLKLAMKSIVMPLLDAEPTNDAFSFLAGNEALLPLATWAMLAAAFGEETVYRGFLFERLRRLIGPRPRAAAGIVLMTSLLFGAVHYSTQGLAGVQQAVVTGIVFGTMYAATGTIWMPMIAHAAFDLTALAIIYCDIEAEIAGAFFG
jgi:uncharacterized protein